MPVGLSRLLEGSARPADLRAGPWRALYPWQGELSLAYPGGQKKRLAPGEGTFLGREAVSCTGQTRDTRYFLWEICPPDAHPELDPANLAELLRYDMPLVPEEAGTNGRAVVLRFERVDLTPGVRTPRHTHRGSGLRVLIKGRLKAEVGGVQFNLSPGGAWLEKGPGEPVIGSVPPGVQAAFVRLMVLPAAAAQQDSFVFLDEGEDRRARPAAYQRFHEVTVDF